MNNIEINEEQKKLVIARIDARMPPTLKLSIGGMGSFSKEELIKHIKEGDPVGKQVVMMHLNFIKAVTTGKFTQAISKV